jgi:hypothetical protein
MMVLIVPDWPEAHSERSTPTTLLLTVLGATFAFLVTRFV